MSPRLGLLEDTGPVSFPGPQQSKSCGCAVPLSWGWCWSPELRLCCSPELGLVLVP